MFAIGAVQPTLPAVNQRALQERLLPTPFVASYIARARSGELRQADLAARAAAWAHWSIGSLVEMSGRSERTYVALTLPGRFYDPHNRHPDARPHIEIPESTLRRPSPDFPDRLALMGNGLTFPWWVFSEVTAVRRALFNVEHGNLDPVLATLVSHRAALADALVELTARATAPWYLVEGLLATDAERLSVEATGDAGPEEVATFLPAAAEHSLEVVFDERLREKSGAWAPRRVGVWQVRSRAHRVSFGVVTPRLTANSLFSDPIFAPATESPAALLVRGLVLARILRRLEPGAEIPVAAVASERPRPSAFLRGQQARDGARMPEASIEGAVAFLQSFPDGDDAWRFLHEWATRSSALLTTTEVLFKASHANALRYLRRAEAPERDDLNVVLPLAWIDGHAVRVLFVRGGEAE